MSPIVTPEYNFDIYPASIYALDNFFGDTVPTVEVPIKQLISAEPSLSSPFRNLTTGMGKMIHSDLDSPGIAANNSRTARQLQKPSGTTLHPQG
jgi:hypothetical protein